MSRPILVNDFAGHPFQYQLAQYLSQSGRSITHQYCSSFSTPHAGLRSAQNLEVQPISTGATFEKYRIWRRIIDELRYGVSSVRNTSDRPVAVLLSNVPILSLLVLLCWARVRRVRTVLWLQDLQSGLAGSMLGSNRAPIARALAALEHRCIHMADDTVAISDEFRDAVIAIGLPPSRVTVIPNWAPLDNLPRLERDNYWARERGLVEPFTFVYSGTIGKKHRPEVLLELARRYDDCARIVVVSEGPGADWLKQEAAKQAIRSLSVYPFADFSDLAAVLASADVLIVLLTDESGAFSVPSKTLSYLCAERPILALVPRANAAAQLLTESGAGLVAQDLDGLLADAERLRLQPMLRAEMASAGRRYAEEHFDIQRIGARFLKLLIKEEQ